MKWSINDRDYNNLFLAVASALDIALQGSASSTEPQLVANLVWHLPRKINAVSLTSGFSVKSGGVFVHSQPFVKCDNFPQQSPRSVEIGDLLLLRTGIRGSTVDRSAIMLQAKKYDTLPVSPDNENQHHLYAFWPRFEYIRSTKFLNGKKRHVSGLDLYNASKYLLIDRMYPNCLCYPICALNRSCLNPRLLQTGALIAQPSKPNLSYYQCFLFELINFILGDAGKPYQTPPPRYDKNWDRVIEDLTTVTAKRVTKYMQRASSDASSTRGQYLFFRSGCSPKGSTLPPFSKLSLLERHNNELNGPPEVPGEWGNDEGEEGGLSIIEFVTTMEG
ncbi:MAG: hypothetical protein WCJ37_04440 [Syntrophus sp. (in: bacteria)]